MTRLERIVLAEVRAKYGPQRLLPGHSVGCGIYWDSTCVNCLPLWIDHDRERELPPILRAELRKGAS